MQSHLIDIQEVGDLHEIIQLLNVEYGYKLRKANLKVCAVNIYFILSGRILIYIIVFIYSYKVEITKCQRWTEIKKKERNYILTVLLH